MELSIGYLKSENQFDIIKFSDNKNTKLETKDIVELQDERFDLLLLHSSEIHTPDIAMAIEKHKQFCPIRMASDFSIANFSSLNTISLNQVYSSAREQWVLQNNLKTLNNLFTYLAHLDKFWPNDRTNFFQELWFQLKNNIGAQKLTLIYNDIKKSQKEHEKNKLIHVKIEGDKIPHPFDGEDIEQRLMKDFSEDFSSHFNIIMFEKEKNELTATFSINQSPVLLLAKTCSFGPLQKAVITALIDGINFDKVLH